MAIFNSFLYVYQRVTSLISRSRGPATGGPPHVRGTGPRNLVPKKRSCWCRKNMEKNTKKHMENHGKQALWGFSISRNRPFYLKLQYLWSGQQAVTTGCDNRYQFVRADDIRQIQLVDHLRPTFDIVPNIAKTKKRNRLDSLDRPSWTAKLRWISLFVTKKTRQIGVWPVGDSPAWGTNQIAVDYPE